MSLRVDEVQQIQDEVGWSDETTLQLILDFIAEKGNEDLKQMVVSHLSDIAHVELLTDSMDFMDWGEQPDFGEELE